MQQIERHHNTEEKPIVSHLFDDARERFSWLAVEMNENALNNSFEEVAETHIKSNVLSERWLEIRSKVQRLGETEAVDLKAVCREKC